MEFAVDEEGKQQPEPEALEPHDGIAEGVQPAVEEHLLAQAAVEHTGSLFVGHAAELMRCALPVHAVVDGMNRAERHDDGDGRDERRHE